MSLESFDVAGFSSLPWGLSTWREAVEEDCQSAICKAKRLVYSIASHVETNCIIQNHHISDSSRLCSAAPMTLAVSRVGWLGALDCVSWVFGPRYAMRQWHRRPWEWWNTTSHIQTQSKADPWTIIRLAAATTPPRMPGFARLTSLSATLVPRDAQE